MTFQDELAAQTLKTVKQAQDITLVAINRIAERVNQLPKLDADALPKIPALENLPKPVAVVEKAFDLSSLLLASARNVAVEATRAFSPEPKRASTPVTTGTKTGTKTAAKKPVKKTVTVAE